MNKQIRPQLDIRRSAALLGSDYRVSWTVDLSRLTSKSIVYSFGIGKDLSFESALISRLGLCVHAFDPTRDSVQWLVTQKISNQLVFHEVGLAGHDGYIDFFEEKNAGADVSKTAIDSRGEFSERAPVKRLKTIMSELGHKRIDLLKMDIEGCEYDVLADLVREGIQVDQLLIEFHHRWKVVGHGKTIESLQLLRRYGYLVFAVSGLWDEYSLIHRSAIGQ